MMKIVEFCAGFSQHIGNLESVNEIGNEENKACLIVFRPPVSVGGGVTEAMSNAACKL